MGAKGASVASFDPVVWRNVARSGGARELLCDRGIRPQEGALLVAVGLNQKGATVADREVLAVAADQWPAILAGYAELGGVDEVAVLSTCYRVEIYAAARCPAAASLALRQAVQARAGRDL